MNNLKDLVDMRSNSGAGTMKLEILFTMASAFKTAGEVTSTIVEGLTMVASNTRNTRDRGEVRRGMRGNVGMLVDTTCGHMDNIQGIL